MHLTKDPNAMAELAQKMLGNYLVTKQTPPNGVLVNNVRSKISNALLLACDM